jgi:hypothetical protein
MLEALYAGFPDWHYDHEPPEVDGDTIEVKWRQGGTHTGTFDFPGLPPILPTGRTVEMPQQSFFYQVQDELITQIRPQAIAGGAPGGILKQLGIDSVPF